jgi:hypothetical protein
VSPAGNSQGRATALTMLTPLKRWRALFLRILFWVGSILPLPEWTLLRLKRIHFASFSIVSRIPPYGKREELHSNYLLFQSNFNGTWHHYIEGFSYVFPTGMTVLWGNCHGWPGPVPVDGLKEYVWRNEYVAQHYYSAYPEASTKMVLAGLEVEKKLNELVPVARSLEPAEFERRWRQLLTDLQAHI